MITFWGCVVVRDLSPANLSKKRAGSIKAGWTSLGNHGNNGWRKTRGTEVLEHIRYRYFRAGINIDPRRLLWRGWLRNSAICSVAPTLCSPRICCWLACFQVSKAANAWVGEEISGAISPRLEINTQGFVCSLHALWTESQWYAPVSKIVHLCSSRFRCGVCCEYLRNSEDYSQWHVEALGRRYYTLLIRD